jgi:hypothetical protein
MPAMPSSFQVHTRETKEILLVKDMGDNNLPAEYEHTGNVRPYRTQLCCASQSCQQRDSRPNHHEPDELHF